LEFFFALEASSSAFEMTMGKTIDGKEETFDHWKRLLTAGRVS